MNTREISRREMLRYLAYGGAGLVVGGALVGYSADRFGWFEEDLPRNERLPTDGRVLLVVEMGGGNDGLSTFVPFEDGTYRDLRPTLAIGPEDVIDWGDGWGLNKHLAALDARKVALVTGVGTQNPDLSHFAMLDRWWKGFPEGIPVDDLATWNTGFLGRICDAVAGDEQITGMSLRVGNAPILQSTTSGTTSVPDTDAADLDPDGDRAKLMRAALQNLAAGDDAALAEARKGMTEMLWLFDLLADLPAPSEGYPDTLFGLQMASASRLIRSNAGLRVIHVPQGVSDYDTHARHGENHPKLLAELNDGLEAFFKDMDEVGLSDQILIATVSEFGRRAEEHDGGLDHGAASTLMMLGPVTPGLHGEHSSLTELDPMGNLVASMSFDRYLATLAQWMEVDPADVQPNTADGKPPEPIEGLLTI